MYDRRVLITDGAFRRDLARELRLRSSQLALLESSPVSSPISSTGEFVQSPLGREAIRRAGDLQLHLPQMVERFFATNKAGGGPTMTLLSGPPSSGKTSLLFQFAINCASESCGGVVFLCNKRKLGSKPPFLSQGIDPSSGALLRIQMKYIEDDIGLKKYFAAFHLHENFPAAVVVDDFGDFFSDRNCQDRYGNARGKDLAMVRTLALCRDAIAYANKKLHHGRSCKFLISDTHQGDNPRQLFIYKRWIECIFTIHGDGQGLFYLKTGSTAGNVLERTRTAKYSIALHHLQLEEIVDA